MGIAPSITEKGVNPNQLSDQDNQAGLNTNGKVAGLKLENEAARGETSPMDPSSIMQQKRGAFTLSDAQGLNRAGGPEGESPFQVDMKGAHGNTTQVDWSELDGVTGGMLASDLRRINEERKDSEHSPALFIQTLNGLARVAQASEKKNAAEMSANLMESQELKLQGTKLQVNSDEAEFVSPSQREMKDGLGANLGITPDWLAQSIERGHVGGLKTTGEFTAVLNRDQLSDSSIQLMSQQVLRTFQKGGGEFKMKLNPRELGEMIIHVKAMGDEVALKIQTSNQRIKEIVEGGMNSLKEKLSHQQLVLANCDVSVTPGVTDDSSWQSRQMAHLDDQPQQGWNQSFFQHQNSNHQRSEFRQRDEDSALSRPTLKKSVSSVLMPLGHVRNHASQAGQIDLHA